MMEGPLSIRMECTLNGRYVRRIGVLIGRVRIVPRFKLAGQSSQWGVVLDDRRREALDAIYKGMD